MLLRVWNDSKWQDIRTTDFPCAISLSPEGVPVFGSSAESAAAWISLSNHQLFVQTTGGPTPILLNGTPIEDSSWLVPGDTISIGTTGLRLRQDAEALTLSPDDIDAAEQAPAQTTENGPRPPARAPSFAPLPGTRLNRRKRNTALAIFMLLLLAVLFVLTAVPVRIAITPQPDTISLSRFPLSIKIRGRYLVMPGTYRIIAAKTGFRELNESVTIGFGSRPTFTFMLRELPALFNITTRPVDGAKVSINKNVIGTSPLQNIALEKGSHEIRITAQGHLPHVQQIESPGMGIRQHIDITLEPGENTQSPQPLPPGGSVEITLISSPSGARILLNGEFQGNTPATLNILPGKKHQLTLSKSGFATATRSVRINADNTQTINVGLEPEYGVVFITCRPADATLTIDGKALGPATRRLRLTTQPHTVEISKPGHETFTTTVTPVVGVSKNLNVQLQSSNHTNPGSASGISHTAEGQVLRTIRLPKPVTFEMGASRREPGRRSNERLHRVTLTRTFSISEKEVTNAEFRRFKPDHSSGTLDGFDLDKGNQPVTSVSWDAAARYLNWLSKKQGLPAAYVEKDGRMVAVHPINTGYRLPTEAEWEFVARYAGRKHADDKPLKYPWGNDRIPQDKNGNYADSSAGFSLPIIIKGYTDGYAAAAPVGTFPANAAGLYDMGGNISEWCHDYYDVFSGPPTGDLRDPAGPPTGTHHVIRGSSWRHGSIVELRLSYRDYADKPRNDLGFRIARYEKK